MVILRLAISGGIYPVHLAYFLAYILISMSTPAGRFMLLRASMVFGVGFAMSISRLWMRISNCSREFLCTKVERLTVYLVFSVGNGTGPKTSALVRLAVSTIWRADWSISLWS